MSPVAARYTALFETRRAQQQGVFVPFFMLGDPDLATSARLLRAAFESGADALEVGIPFSDPVADGPVIQRAALRAQAAGATAARCFGLIADLRATAPDLPIGLLTYANLVVHRGAADFYARAAQAGIDSVLVADVPAREAAPFCDAARAHGIAPILIAPPDAPESALAEVALLSAGYTYCVARKGVTGADQNISLSHGRLFQTLQGRGAPPPLLGFGISRPAHVRAALAAGAAGAISGSAVAARIEENAQSPDAAILAVARFVCDMKEATWRDPSSLGGSRA
jgi:tryptophan synthase alpha chain